MKVLLFLFTLLYVQIVPAQVIGENTIRLNVSGKSFAFKSGHIKVGDMYYHYLAKGTKNRPLILFLHGFPEIAAAWKDQLYYFSQDYYAVAIDMKGANLSSIPEATDKFANYSVSQLATEVNTLALMLSNGKPYFVVGHDWGATTAWNVAFSYSQNLRGMVVVNGAHSLLYFREYFSRTDAFQYNAAEYIRNIISGTYSDGFYLNNNFAELRSVLFENPIGNASAFFNDEMKSLYLEYWSTPGSVNAGMNYYRAINFDLLKPLYAENAPPIEKNELPFLKKYHLKAGTKTLVIWGQKDIYISPKVNDGLEGFFENPADLTIKRFENNSHWIVHEDSELVTKEIADFLVGK